ncbi:uncharacterized protein [Choristoneura fumiferana]|uniref:uncharacterized protein n=1 Tax=Choristoneura fumiferana TaxID=7141 RepID=UPI003D154776
MQCLYLLLLVAVCQGLAVQKVKAPLPRPEIKSVTTLDPLSIQVEWNPVQSIDEKDPVIGYKIKVWELPPIITFKYVVVDGVMKLVEDVVEPKINDAETPPEKEAKEIVVQGPLVSKALVPDLKLNVVHEVRVRAYTKSQDGPLSGLTRIQLQDTEKPVKHDNNVYKFV